MILYAESSAVLAWLLGESTKDVVHDALRRADRVLTSVITDVECARAIVRGASLGRLTRPQAVALVRQFREVQAGWDRIELTDPVRDRAAAPFPVEPIRTLDAIHVASAELAQRALGTVTVLSFDDRVRTNALGLGMPVWPEVVGD